MKKIMLLFPSMKGLQDFHLNKDVGLFISYFCKEYYLDGEIVSIETELSTKMDNYSSVKITKLKNKNIWDYTSKVSKVFKFIYLIKLFHSHMRINIRKTDVLMMFYLNPITVCLAAIAKFYNRDVKIYIKSDDSVQFLSIKKKYVTKALLRMADLISSETIEGTNLLVESFPGYEKKIQQVPNGFDDNYLKNSEVKYDKLEKEKIILSTARFGTYQKNTELLLDICKDVKLKDYKVLLAGPIEENEQFFSKKIDTFFDENPELEGKVEFVGNIRDRDELYQLYARSSIYLFTSRYEGFALSLVEAAYFGNYIITTDVGCATDILGSQEYGFIAEHSKENRQNIQLIKNSIVDHMNDLVCNRDYKVYDNYKEYMAWARGEYSMSKIVKSKHFNLFFKDISSWHR